MRPASAGLLALVALLAALAPSTASASTLVYACGVSFEDLCQARPDGSGQAPITTNGDPSVESANRYASPALSRDGTKLLYTFANDLYVRDRASGATAKGIAQNEPILARFRGDGARFGVAEVSSLSRRTQVCTYNTDLSGRNEGRWCLATGVNSGFDFLPDGRVVMSRSGGTESAGRTEICLLFPEGSPTTGCERTLAADPVLNLESPAVSPDGRLLAVVLAESRAEGALALYDLATGALIRRLTAGPADSQPVFSPAGDALAFTRGEAIWTTAVTAAPGAERQVVARGRSASWGGGDSPGGAGPGPGAAPGSGASVRASLKARQRGRRVRLSLRVAPVGSRLSVSLRSAGVRGSLGGFSRRRVRSGRVVVRVGLNARGRQLLARRRVLRLRVRVTLTPPQGAAVRASRRVTLRR